MTGKRSKRLNSALVSVGMIALVAGCGGGGGGGTSGGSTGPGSYVPPSKVPAQMTNATLTLRIPARRSAGKSRRPNYISQATMSLSAQAAVAGAPSPWPSPVVTSVPSPGPSPTTLAVTLPVPVGNDIFVVGTYDGPVVGPSSGPQAVSGYLLSSVTSTPVPVMSDAANNVSLILDAAANCVKINGKTGGSFTLNPIENQTGPQTATFTVTPCDADGYAITSGNLGNAITFATPAPVNVVVTSKGRRPMSAAPAVLTFSTPVITSGGDTLETVTYPAGNNGTLKVAAAPSPLPANLNPSYVGSITADPYFLVMVSNRDSNNVSVRGSDAQGVTGIFNWSADLAAGLYPSGLVAGGPQNGCAQGGQAVVFNTNGPFVFTLPTPSPTNPTPVPGGAGVTPSGATFFGPSTASSIDPATCNVYASDSSSPGGYIFALTAQMSSANLLGGPYTTSAGGPAPVSGIAFANATVYAGLGQSGGYLNNIVDAGKASDTGAGPGTQAMLNYTSTSIIVANQSPPGSDTFLGVYSPPTATFTSPADLGLNSAYNPVRGMAMDPAGNVWAVASPGTLYQYTPATGLLKTYSLPVNSLLGTQTPTSIAIASNGMIFITDNSTTPGTLGMYSSSNITGGLSATKAQLLGSFSTVGNNPNGVAIFP